MADHLESKLKSLEDEIFYQVDLKLWEQLRASRLHEEKRQLLSKLMNVQDQVMLDELIEQGIDHQTVAVLLMVPLAFIAWADGRVTETERTTVMEIASRYSREESPAFAKVVKQWLDREPSEALWNAWIAYIHTFREQSRGPATEMLAEKLMDHARSVAEASSNFLSFKRINPEKQQALNRLRDALQTE